MVSWYSNFLNNFLNNFPIQNSFLVVFAATKIDAYQVNCQFVNTPLFGTQYYACRGLNYDAFCKDRNITSITGAHTGQNTNDQVEHFYIRDVHSECIPRLLQTFFRNIKALHIHECFLSELHSDDLLGLNLLEDVWFGNNLIETVPAKFFDHTPNLRRFSFIGNRIKHFVPSLSLLIARLTSFELTSNVCINFNGNSPRALRQLHGLLKVQCKPEVSPINTSNTIDNTCINSTCTNVIYSFGGTGQGDTIDTNDTIETM